MENHFEMGLDALRQKILLMASRAETAVNQSVQSLVQRDYDLAVRVREYGLIRKDVDVESWFEPHYLEAALRAQQLEHFWPHYDAAGKKRIDGDVEQTLSASK